MKYLINIAIIIGKLTLKASVFFPILAFLFWSEFWLIASIVFYSWMILGYITRRYNTNAVFNYCLQNDIHLPRLNEIKWYYDKATNCYFNNVNGAGYIKYRKISKIEFIFAFLLWLWVDNDSENDTTDQGIIMDRIISKKTHKWMPEFLRNIVKKEKEKAVTKGFIGKAWSYGDARKSEWYWISSIFWLFRNTAYGYNYMLEEMREDSKYNFFKVIKIFGFATIWGYIPYENSTRKGRLVFWQEDLDKIDKEVLEKYTRKN